MMNILEEGARRTSAFFAPGSHGLNNLTLDTWLAYVANGARSARVGVYGHQLLWTAVI